MYSLPRPMCHALVWAVWMCHVLLAGQVMAQSSPKVHDLKAAPDTVHRGFFDAALKPVLTIDSGDIVRLETVTGNPRYFEKLGVSKEKIPAELYRVFEGVDDARRWDHTLNGPIYVNQAEPGDMLEIRIRSVDLWLPMAGQSFVPNRGLLPEEFPYARDRVLWLDLEHRTVTYAPGVVVPLKPFWGIIRVAPPPGMWRMPRGPPNVFGGNMDNRDLGAGSTLYWDRLRPQLIELTIFALALLEPSEGVATHWTWASATRADRTDSALGACPRERRDNASTSA
jgi:Acetamidase/Formamidase family